MQPQAEATPTRRALEEEMPTLVPYLAKGEWLGTGGGLMAEGDLFQIKSLKIQLS